MASMFPNGTVFSISTAYGASSEITSISNAKPPVATAAGHTFNNGDILLLSASSTRLDQRVARVANKASGTFELENFNTTKTNLFPSGFGAGSAIVVSGFEAMSQITDSNTSGGEQQYAQWVYLEDGRQRQRKTFKNARALQLTLDYDPNLAWHDALLDADQEESTRVLRASLPNGDMIYWSVEVSFSGEPSYTINQNMAVVAEFSLMAQDSTRYSAA